MLEVREKVPSTGRPRTAVHRARSFWVHAPDLDRSLIALFRPPAGSPHLDLNLDLKKPEHDERNNALFRQCMQAAHPRRLT
jgi:hypothetical protein